MNFRIFGGSLALIGFLLGAFNFSAAFPNFGKPEPTLSDALNINSDYYECLLRVGFDNGNLCGSSGEDATSGFLSGSTLFYSGVALLVLGAVILLSTIKSTRVESSPTQTSE